MFSKKKIAEILTVILFIVVFSFRTLDVARKTSPVFDEIAHLPAGYTYLHDFKIQLNPEHPPLCKMMAAIPLFFYDINSFQDHAYLLMKDQWLYGDIFLHHNKISPDTMILLGRIPMFLFGIALAVFVYLWTRRLYGIVPAFTALFLCTFSPNIIANTPLVATDMANTCMIFMSIYTFWAYLNDQSRKNLIAAGICFGIALAVKYTSLFVLPFVYPAMVWIHRRKELFTKEELEKWITPIYVFTGIPLIILFLVYFGDIKPFFTGLDIILNQTLGQVDYAFLNGDISHNGFRTYYFYAFLMKTPLALILMILLYLVSVIKFRSYNKNISFLLLPVIFFFIVASLSKKQLGIRYVLPIYPFIYVGISGIMLVPKYLVDSQKKMLAWISRIVLGCILLWYGFSSVSIHPHYLSYFNELAGGPDNGWKHLGDSNLDWGQDLKGLSEYLKQEGNPPITLSYFGCADPAAYGISYRPLQMYPQILDRKGTLGPNDPQSQLLAVSVTFLQGLYIRPQNYFYWLRDKIPKKKIGYSIFIYDLKDLMKKE